MLICECNTLESPGEDVGVTDLESVMMLTTLNKESVTMNRIVFLIQIWGGMNTLECSIMYIQTNNPSQLGCLKKTVQIYSKVVTYTYIVFN